MPAVLPTSSALTSRLVRHRHSHRSTRTLVLKPPLRATASHAHASHMGAASSLQTAQRSRQHFDQRRTEWRVCTSATMPAMWEHTSADKGVRHTPEADCSSNRTAAGAAQHAARHAESEAARHGQRQSCTSHALPRPTAKPTAVSFAMTAAAVIIITSLHQAAVRRWCMYSDGSVIWCPNVRSSWKQKQMSVETSVRATDLGGRCIAAPHRHVPRSRHAGPGKWSRLPKCGRDAV